MSPNIFLLKFITVTYVLKSVENPGPNAVQHPMGSFTRMSRA